MFTSVSSRSGSTGLDVFVSGLQRYRLLSAEDKRKLLGAHRLKNLPDSTIDDVKKSLQLSCEPTSAPSNQETVPNSRRIESELQRLKSRSQNYGRLNARIKPVAAGSSKYFMGVDPNSELEHFDITYAPIETSSLIFRNPLFENETETDSLVSDVHKAAAYDDIQSMLSTIRPVPQDMLTDSFLHVMSRAIASNIARVERPILCNELSDFESSYAMQRAALRNLIVNTCTRNAFEEVRVDRFLDKLSFSTQRLNVGFPPPILDHAPLPPEVLEPLVAFRGFNTYSFDSCTRLAQKLANMRSLLFAVIGNDTTFLQMLGTKEECNVIPPNKYPFDNYYGFKSCIPNDVTGSIKMGKPDVGDQVRYHNLQSVAHSLPSDPKYRAVVMHAIRVLERNKGWDHASKVKAINRLVQVYNNLAPSRYYARVLDKAIPLVRKQGSTVSTKSRQETFNRGLKYIQSLTRNHWVKKK
ncbi:hypothetical protein X943_001185 [Babesia divergens]|uniref:Uncharacterized protein n=1 Tax=Babesia divergens TaxID=32595 RepID=A0AAD9GCU9_BABDI|nr:hypothetical protein X943_001185 [Babesia divergens]